MTLLPFLINIITMIIDIEIMMILTYLVRHLMVTLLPFFTTTLPSAGSLTTCPSFMRSLKDLMINMMMMTMLMI